MATRITSSFIQMIRQIERETCLPRSARYMIYALPSVVNIQDDEDDDDFMFTKTAWVEAPAYFGESVLWYP